MPIRYRRALPTDIAAGWRTVRSDWGLFSRALLPRVPGIIANLVEFDRLTMCVLEDSATRMPVNMGGFGFLPREFIARARLVEGRSVLEQAFEAEAGSTATFLNPRQVARGNRSGDLEQLNFMASPSGRGEELQQMASVVYDAWQFFAKGFRLNGIWQENASPVHCDTLVSVGYKQVRQFTRASSEVVTLFHMSREDWQGEVMTFVRSVMTAPRPILGFTDSEQRLLEYALLDYTDQEVADLLQVTPDAIKKRWRSISAKVVARDPATLQGVVSAIGRRRAILGRLRARLEELRPYART